MFPRLATSVSGLENAKNTEGLEIFESEIPRMKALVTRSKSRDSMLTSATGAMELSHVATIARTPHTTAGASAKPVMCKTSM